MISNRSYMRDEFDPTGGRKVLRILIFTLIGVFCLQAVLEFVWPKTGFLTELLAARGGTLVRGYVWTPLTYALLHDTGNVLHILFNLLGLYFLGRALLEPLGPRRFLGLAAVGAVCGAVLWLVLNFDSPAPLVGASAAVFALLAAFCLWMPNQPITLLLFFVLPVTIKPKWIGWAALGLTLFGLLFSELRQITAVAHSAHLGGMIGGFLFWRFAWEGRALSFSSVRRELPGWWKKKEASAATTQNYTVNVRRDPADLKVEVDRILDKINAHGFHSLTPEEKRLLDEAKDILSKR